MLTDNLISYYKLDEASGNAADSHGSNTMVNQNTMSYAAGKINNAANPASSGNKFLKIANASQTGLDITGNITVSLWVKTSENSKYILFFTDGATAVGYGLAMGTAAGKPIGQIAVFVGQNWFTTTSSTRIDNNAWHHVVFTMSGTSVALYLDGSADGTGTATTGLSYTGDRTIGDNHTTNTLNALVDEVGIWSRALSASEVSSLYNGGAGLQYPFTVDNKGVEFFMNFV